MICLRQVPILGKESSQLKSTTKAKREFGKGSLTLKPPSTYKQLEEHCLTPTCLLVPNDQSPVGREGLLTLCAVEPRAPSQGEVHYQQVSQLVDGHRSVHEVTMEYKVNTSMYMFIVRGETKLMYLGTVITSNLSFIF